MSTTASSSVPAAGTHDFVGTVGTVPYAPALDVPMSFQAIQPASTGTLPASNRHVPITHVSGPAHDSRCGFVVGAYGAEDTNWDAAICGAPLASWITWIPSAVETWSSSLDSSTPTRFTYADGEPVRARVAGASGVSVPGVANEKPRSVVPPAPSSSMESTYWSDSSTARS